VALNVAERPNILLTNDDGYQAPGLRALAEAFAGFATISIVAPSREQSGAAQSLTLRQPIICHSIAEREWAVDGTPADAVIVALHRLLPERPDLVISGINWGANLGENVYYSGTVGAAREAALHHIPALAISLCSKSPTVKFDAAATVARTAAELILKEGLPDQVLLNVNVPEPWLGGVRFTRQSKKITRNQLSQGKDPRGQDYYWLFEQRIDKDVAPDTDYAAIFAGDVSITPLHLDPTDSESLNLLSPWAKPIQAAFASLSVEQRSGTVAQRGS
jgi:5'-nucleotidase